MVAVHRSDQTLPDGATHPDRAFARAPAHFAKSTAEFRACLRRGGSSRENGGGTMKKILVVEDDPKISAALLVRLKAAGYDAVAAQDGFNGLKMAVTHRPDLILLDIMMPVGMGFSVAERLKDLGLADTPIVFITASKRAGLRKMAQKLGAAGFFEKPYDAEELMAALNLILDNRPAPSAPALPVRPNGLRDQPGREDSR